VSSRWARDLRPRLTSGVTHLLLADVGSSIALVLPSLITVLAPSLLVADLSNNELSFLPESLRYSALLEELNVSNNPIRALPVWVSDLNSLHVMVVDGCGLATMPGELSQLSHLHTICGTSMCGAQLISSPSQPVCVSPGLAMPTQSPGDVAGRR
jgi:hypothetical protein